MQLTGDAIDSIIGKGQVDFSGVQVRLVKIAGMIVACAAGTFIMNMINNRMAYKIVQDIRSKAIRHIQVLPLSYLDAHSTGDIVGRIITDVDQISDGLLLGFTRYYYNYRDAGFHVQQECADHVSRACADTGQFSGRKIYLDPFFQDVPEDDGRKGQADGAHRGNGRK